MKILKIEANGKMALENVRTDNVIRRYILQGGIETIYLDENMSLKMMINDSGKLISLPRNSKADSIIEYYRIDTDHICGTVVLTGVSEDGTSCSINPEQLEEVFSIFKEYCPFNYYEAWYLKNRRKLSRILEDPDGLVSSWRGHIEGIYLIEVEYGGILTLAAYVGQAGRVQGQPSYYATNIHTRLLQHLKRFFGNDYASYFTGVQGLEDFGKYSSWKIKVRLLQEEYNHARRLTLEDDYIKVLNPYLQNHKYPYYKTTGNVEDACILPRYRKQALEDSVTNYFRKNR